MLEPPEEWSDRIEESLVHLVKGVPQLLLGNPSHAAQSLNKVLRCVKQFCYQLSKSAIPDRNT